MRAVKTRRARKKKKIQYFDYSLLAVIIFLMCFGLVMLFSSSSYSAQDELNDSMFYLKRQGAIGLGSFALMLVVSRIDYHIYARFAKPLYWVSIFMMALVQTPLGVESNGSKRWLSIAGQRIQPSEIAKVAVILFIPVILCEIGKKIVKIEGIIKVLIWGGFSAVCVFLLTDNLSTAVIVMGITVIMIFVVYPNPKAFAKLALAGGVAVIVLVGILSASDGLSSNFRLRRVMVWLHPEDYASTWGYQVMQGLYAIGSGGFFGKGLGNSVQKMIIPEVQNDMILSVICEELGVFGAIIVLILFGMLLYRLMFIAQNAPDMYGSLIVTGIFAHIALQVILNVAVVINLIPTTGITLPFISYGGTSILFLLTEMGIALGVSRTIRFEE